MGSSLSRPTDNDTSNTPVPSTSPRRRMNTLRRLSTLGRRSTKRDRAQSLDPSERDKRQRTGSPEEFGRPIASGSGTTSIDEDPLALERTQTIETIREVLGDDWTPPEPQSPPPRPAAAAQTTLSSSTSPGPPILLPNGAAFRPIPVPPNRSQVTAESFRPTGNLRRRWSAEYIPEPPIRSVSDDYIPLQRSQSHVPPIILHHPDRGEAPIPRWYFIRLEERLRILSNQRLEMRERLAQIQRAIDRSDGRATAAEAELARRRANVAASTTTAEPTTQETNGVRTPGAVLMIQGLAQMQNVPPPPPSTGRRRFRFDTARLQATDQAQMIANLLTVASAATATTLWSSAEPRPQPNRMLETLMARIRPRRPFSVRRNLGSYVYDAMGPQSGSEASNDNTASDFLSWLDNIQGELMTAMREYSRDNSSSLTRRNSDQPPLSTDAEPIRPEARRRGSAPDPTTPPPSTPIASPPTLNVPLRDYHHQEGQTRPQSAVTITDDEGSRRLNFFRAHIFPPSDPTDTSENPIVPCVFVGVRSISHDPSQSPADLLAHPSFPFSDGQVPPNDTEATQDRAGSTDDSIESATDQPSRTDTPTSAQSRAQSLRSRILALSPFSRSPASPTASAAEAEESTEQETPPDPAVPMSTFLVYVVGGNYPRNHPILSIPSLVTGEPLTDEEMVLVGELMGQVKPPTATAEEVENSGLKVIDASGIMGMVETGEILAGSAERCLVCLSDFESGEDCRLLGCRHVFHKDCVDQWIKVGRNACPACRTEAVDKSKTKPEIRSQEAEVGPSSDVPLQESGIAIV